MDSLEDDDLIRSSAILTLAAVAGVFCYGQAATDWAYQLAGLADPFLGRPAPGWTVALLAVASAVLVMVWLGARSLVRSPSAGSVERPAPRRRSIVRWWWILLAAWGGYALGAAATVAAGGPVDHPGSMRLTFGSPVDGTADVAVTCRSAPGKPTVITQVIPDVGTVPRIDLRNPSTGERRQWPAGTGVSLQANGPSTQPLTIPGVPDRAPMYSIGMGVDGPLYGPTIPFLAAYFYNVTNVDDRGASGTLEAVAQRAHIGMNIVNDLVPDDPWPESYGLGMTWTCDLATTMPWSAPPAAPPVEHTRGPIPSPLRDEPDGVPVEITIATTSEWLSVKLGGSRIVGSELTSLGGTGASATRDGQVLTLQRSAGGSGSGATVAATFDVVLADLTAGSTLDASLRQGSEGVGAVTLSNALGPVPLPVVVLSSQPQPVMSAPPAPVSAEWLVRPFAPAVAPGG